MGEPILKSSDVPTKLSPNKDHAVVKSEIDVDGSIWYVTCVSMGNPHCVTFSNKGSQVIILATRQLYQLQFPVHIWQRILDLFKGIKH